MIARGKSHRNGTSGSTPARSGTSAGDGEADAAALAAAGHRDPRRVDRGHGPDRLDGTDRVGEDAPVVVGRRIEDALGHEPGVERRAGGIGVRRVADRPGGPLAARVHHQVGVAGGRVQDPLVRQPAAAAVADVLDDRRQRARATRRQVEPRPDRRPAEPGERDVEACRRPRARCRPGSQVTARSCARASASVADQKASRSAGHGQVGRVARSSSIGRSDWGKSGGSSQVARGAGRARTSLGRMAMDVPGP